MTLSIFDRLMGTDRKALWPTDAEAQGELAGEVLDSVQTIVDVLVDRDQDYRVGFAPDATAYTDFNAKRIAITAKPLTEGGRPLAEIVDILTGFAVHETGHARLDDALSDRINTEWPGKVSPKRLSNTMQDVRLERAIIDRFPGLAGVFDPTFEWVVAQDPTATSSPIAYGTALDERLNFVGMVARYRRYITVATDAVSVAEEAWWTAFIGRITGSTTDDQMMAMLREGLAHLRIDADAPKPKAPPSEQPGTPQPTPPDGGEGQPVAGSGDPDEDDLTEGDSDDADAEGEGEGEGEGTGDEPGDDAGQGEGEPGDGDGEGKPEGGDGDADGGQPGEGKSGDADGDAPGGAGDMAEGESLDRVESDSPMGTGSGGSGKAITNATDTDDVDEGLRPDKLKPTLDEVNAKGYDYSTQTRADDARRTDRLDAGAFGTLKVRVML